jgi:putative endonuclease
MSERYYCVYILGSIKGALYIGVTNNLPRRVLEHKEKLFPCHTAKYKNNRLLYFEQTTDVYAAIAREKQLKKWRRAWKEALINRSNPGWKDLFPEIVEV